MTLIKQGMQLGVDSGQMAIIPIDPKNLQMEVEDDEGPRIVTPEDISRHWAPWLLSGQFGFGMVVNLVSAGTYPVYVEMVDMPEWGNRVARLTMLAPDHDQAPTEVKVGSVTTPTGWVVIADPSYFHDLGGARLGMPPYRVAWWGRDAEAMAEVMRGEGFTVIAEKSTHRMIMEFGDSLQQATSGLGILRDLAKERGATVMSDLMGNTPYDQCCDVTSLARNAGEYPAEIGMAAASSTGFGDGVYWAEVYRGLDGSFSGLTVTFITVEEVYESLFSEAEDDKDEETPALTLVDEIRQDVEKIQEGGE